MNSAELRNAFRQDVDDEVVPYLWSDDEISAYMTDAQRMFARLTRGIRDATSLMCSVDMVPGEAFAEIDKRILRITRIQRDSDAQPLGIVNIEDMDAQGIRLDNTQGRVDTVLIGLEPHKLRWVRMPQVADTASMVVERLPLNAIVSTRSTPLEIDEQHHRALLMWMEALAYAKQDADTRDADKAELKDAKFRAYCAAALIEKGAARHKTRTVRYGGL